MRHQSTLMPHLTTLNNFIHQTLFLSGSFSHSKESGFGLAFVIEEQRKIDATSNRKIIQPRATVVDTSQRDTTDDIFVAHKHGEGLPVALSVTLGHIAREASGIIEPAIVRQPKKRT